MLKSLRIMAVSVALFATVSAAAQNGSLRVGDARVSGDRVTVPVTLGLDGEAGISALDFRLRYDPGVFEAVDVSAGTAASGAGKQVLGNSIAPGDYKVLMFGLNQDTVAPGEVVNLELRVLQPPETGSASLRLDDVTLSLPNATDLPASGGTFPVNLPATTQESDDEAEEDAPDEEQPTAESEPGAPAADADTVSAPDQRAPNGTAAPPRPTASAEPPDQPADTSVPKAATPDARQRAEDLRARLPKGGVTEDETGATPSPPDKRATAKPGANTAAPRAEQVASAAPAQPTDAPSDTTQPAAEPSEPATGATAADQPAQRGSGQALRARIIAVAAAALVLLALLGARRLLFP